MVCKQAVAGLETQVQDVENFMEATPLAANFQYLHLVDAVRGTNGFIQYLDLSADVLISKAPENLRKNLRKMYFEGQGIVESNAPWNQIQNLDSFRAFVTNSNGEQKLQVEMVPGLEKLPTVKKFLRLLAIAELTNAAIAQKYFGGRDYRLYHRILDAVNQLSIGLLIQDVIRNTNLGSLKAEIEDFKGSPAIQANLEILTIPNQIQMRMMEVKRQNFGLKSEDILRWVISAEAHRAKVARSIKSLSAVDAIVDEVVQSDLSTTAPEDRFRLLSLAKNLGDTRTMRLLKKLGSIVISGGQARCDSLFN